MQVSPVTVATSVGGLRPRSGFTIVELLVSLGILSLLLAIALPSISRARESARRTECLNHLR